MANPPHRELDWYLAELVMEITVEGSQRNVVHLNLVLLRAESAEDAYNKTLLIGKRDESSYQNPEERLVRIKFCGVKRLELMYESPDDGSELTFEERVGVPPEEIQGWIPPKEHLQVFCRPNPGRKHDPDYRSKEVMEMAIETALRQPTR